MGSDPDFAQRNSGSDPKPGPQGTTPKPQEAFWPRADVVIGNPPFLGDKKMRAELGDAATTALRATYAGRVPGGADLVCYWFDKARAQIAAGELQRAGLVATNSIRGGANRKVLDAICTETRIFEAWSDEAWVNNGAAVRVSLLAFGKSEQAAQLDSAKVSSIQAGLTFNAEQTGDLTDAQRLPENGRTSFQGPVLVGNFDVEGSVARQWLAIPNPHGKSNSEVVRPLTNGKDITSRSRGVWVVDFNALSQADSSLYEQPFSHVETHVKPVRETNRDESRRLRWWLHGRSGKDWRESTRLISRYIATSQVSKHRNWVWQHTQTWPHQTVIAIARADDTTFGILHSRLHELWSMHMGTWLGVGNDARYTPTTCFETFPFPAGLTPLDTAHQRTEAVAGGALIPAGLTGATPEAPSAFSTPKAQNFEQNQPLALMGVAQPAIETIVLRQHATAIAQAAHRLNTLREAWLNPPEWTTRVPEVVPLGMEASPYPDRIVAKAGFEKELAQRTLTKLYNQRPAWLAAAHAQLDAAVAAAYGWDDYTPEMPDDEILRRLLALNLSRSASENP
ncbi:DNA methyltransferase [Simplicispira suum]|uniref:DNA methyltransferase n=1 Tax=Simplicispira suum TaxID=2109915 RepID=UPI0030811804